MIDSSSLLDWREPRSRDPGTRLLSEGLLKKGVYRIYTDVTCQSYEVVLEQQARLSLVFFEPLSFGGGLW